MQSAIHQFQEQIKEAISNRQVLKISGGDTKSWYGDTAQGKSLSTLNHLGILDYQPEELVITVRSGTSLAEVEATLAEKNQYFPFEPPHFGGQATIGGMVAAGLAGPGRGQYGNLRDFVLGVNVMDGTGQTLSFGGKVMKNVAGYDVSRLMPGSLGTLALLLEVSIKVLPRPAKTMTLKFQIHQGQAITQMNSWASQPLPLSASTWVNNELWIRLAGASAAVDAALIKMNQILPAEEIDPKIAEAFWLSIREQQHAFFTSSDLPLWRFSVAPLSLPLPFEHPMMLEWLGGQRWVKSNISPVEARALAHENGGHATLFRGPKDPNYTVFTPLTNNPLTAPLEIVQQRVRKAFDPHGIFQTGRMPN
jgi:glycolate oxidase FAD binding subunit